MRVMFVILAVLLAGCGGGDKPSAQSDANVAIPHAKVIEVNGRQLRHALGDMGCQEGEVLREIALVGAHRVRRRVLVQPEMFEKRLEVVSNHFLNSG